MAFHGNLQVAIREAKTLLEAGVRLAFFAPTSGEVERLADVFGEYSIPYQIDLGGEQVPEYLQQRTQSLNAGIALIRGDVARGTVFQEARLAIFGVGRSVRIAGDRRASVASRISARAFSPPICSI